MGCLIFNSACELGQRGDIAGIEARHSVQAIASLFNEAVTRAQAEGDIAADRDAQALATYLTLGMAGLRTLLKTGADPKQAGAAAKLLLDTLR